MGAPLMGRQPLCKLMMVALSARRAGPQHYKSRTDHITTNRADFDNILRSIRFGNMRLSTLFFAALCGLAGAIVQVPIRHSVVSPVNIDEIDGSVIEYYVVEASIGTPGRSQRQSLDFRFGGKFP